MILRIKEAAMSSNRGVEDGEFHPSFATVQAAYKTWQWVWFDKYTQLIDMYNCVDVLTA